MARGGHGLPKASLGPATPHSSTPCKRATPETAVSAVACPQRGRPAALFYSLGHPTPYAYGVWFSDDFSVCQGVDGRIPVPIPGSRGNTGVDGLQGTVGRAGLPGEPGGRGRDGVPGVRGELGIDGLQGRDGL
jgi:hypothetical protein